MPPLHKRAFRVIIDLNNQNNKSNNKSEKIKQLPTRRDAIITLAALSGAMLLLALFFEQITGLMKQYMLPCALLTLTGLRCPLCGGTRCVMALARLDFAQAVYYNPMVVLALLACGYLYIRLALSCCMRVYKPYSPRMGERGLIVILAAFLTFFVIRNLPFYQTYFY